MTHPFADGNKRTAFLAVGLFVAVNGYRLRAAKPDATLTMVAVDVGECDEASLARWIRVHRVLR